LQGLGKTLQASAIMAAALVEQVCVCVFVCMHICECTWVCVYFNVCARASV